MSWQCCTGHSSLPLTLPRVSCPPHLSPQGPDLVLTIWPIDCLRASAVALTGRGSDRPCPWVMPRGCVEAAYVHSQAFWESDLCLISGPRSVIMRTFDSQRVLWGAQSSVPLGKYRSGATGENFCETHKWERTWPGNFHPLVGDQGSPSTKGRRERG